MYNIKGNTDAFVGMELPISSANIDGTGLMLNERVKYTAKSGSDAISTANTSLTGSGTLSSALVTGATSGTLVKTVTVKAQTSTTVEGMVRLFIYGNSTYYLIAEIPIPIFTIASRDASFEINVPVNFYLGSGWILYASTEKGSNTFSIITESADMTYPT